ncbi:riboflavin kinase [Brevibacillus centrosporus]|uniref:riboflavin kinase n=1 Tax=Brevibacillus centrosporus TaxID=54910 RepID=UPI002E1DB25B|nr:riboflavin kinase [Brevibacillus centrosporus]
MKECFATITGEVIKGRQIGRTIGFPTANIAVEGDQQQMLANGVYGVTVFLEDSSHRGILNKGIRPTFRDPSMECYEVHLFDFSQDIYGKKLTVHVHFFVRAEMKFPSVKYLIRQIKQDILAVREQMESAVGQLSNVETGSLCDAGAIHFTDLQFVKYCEVQYGVNRGVYNTIDSWFYDKGIHHVLERRTKILQFFRYASSLAVKNGEKLSFGNGGLVLGLNKFWGQAEGNGLKWEEVDRLPNSLHF